VNLTSVNYDLSYISISAQPGDWSPPWVHRIFSNLKVWALDVYHGLCRKHLQSYLDEFVFRFNRRRTRHAAFRSLLGIATEQPPHPYKMLISPEAAV
jgi:hypothetical protein